MHSRLPLCLVLLASIALMGAEETPNEKRAVVRIYDISNLISSAPDYPGPELAASSASSVQPSVFAPAENTLLTAASMADMIKTRVRPDSWDAALGTSIEEVGGYLVIQQTPEIHEQIATLLAALNGSRKLLVSVKGLLIPASSIPDATYFSDEELDKFCGGKAEPAAIAAPRVSGFDQQRVHVVSGILKAVVKDLDVTGNAYDLAVSAALDGFLFDVRPTVSFDRTATDVELRATFNSNLTLNPRTLGVQASRGVHAAGVLPMAETSTTSTKNENGQHEITGSGNKESGALLSTQYLAGIAMDFPSAHSNTVRTEVSIPAGKWVLAAVLRNPDSAAPQKHLVLFVASELQEIR